MKKKILLLFLLLFMPLVVNATEEEINNDAVLVLPTPATDMFDNVEKSKFMFHNTITSESNVDGILFAAGETLNINGYNEYGMYAGNNISINNNIGKDLFAAGNSINILSGALINRDVYIAGNIVNINTSIGRDLKVICSSLSLNNTTISGNVNISASNIKFGDNVVIYGSLKYNDNANVTGLDSSTISSVETYHVDEEEFNETFKDSSMSFLYGLISFILIGVAINALFPKIYKSLNKEYDSSKILNNMGIGFLILITIPIACLILMCTGIGLGLALLVLTLYVITLILSLLPCMAIIGKTILAKLFNSKDKPYLSIIIGIFVVRLISQIPLLGGLTCFLMMLVGLGLIKNMMFKK